MDLVFFLDFSLGNGICGLDFMENFLLFLVFGGCILFCGEFRLILFLFGGIRILRCVCVGLFFLFGLFNILVVILFIG